MEPGKPPHSNHIGTRCPCCGDSTRASMLDSFPYRDIWNRLRDDWGFRISEEVVRGNTPCGETTLFECEDCGVQFFVPPSAGNPAFYRELGANPRYYSSLKWEFDWTLSRLSASDEVLDVGCGRGDFLSAAAPRVRRAVGMDWSEDAVARTRALGLEAVVGDLADRADAFRNAFSAVCAFHVLEHLPEPTPFIGLLTRCLRPGGSLFLSVPNRMRSGRAAFEPLDFPPHHLTRWSPRSLERLAAASGLRMCELALEPVDLSVPRDRFRERIRSAASRVPAVGGILGTWAPRLAWRIVLPAPLAALYRRLGLFERAGMVGMSVAVHLSKPSP